MLLSAQGLAVQREFAPFDLEFDRNAVEEWQELGGLGWFIVIGLAGVFSFCTPVTIPATPLGVSVY
eukprot:1978897-Rhodomonas_salina.2